MKADFYAIDFETANESLDSACSIGIVGIKNSKIIIEEHHLFHPHQNFSDFNISIHHITPDMVYGLEDFKVLWNKIYHYFNGTTIVCHNAQFDIAVLQALIERYRLNKPNFEFVCTYRMSSYLWTWEDGFLDHRLNTLARYLDLEFKHHDALEDARVCALVADRIMRITQSTSLKESSKKVGMMPGKYTTTRFFGTYKIDTMSLDENNILSGKVLYFSGKSPMKKKVIAKVQEAGGAVDIHLRENCDYFVMLEGVRNEKLEFAKRQKYIKIITESELLGMLYDI